MTVEDGEIEKIDDDQKVLLAAHGIAAAIDIALAVAGIMILAAGLILL